MKKFLKVVVIVILVIIAVVAVALLALGHLAQQKSEHYADHTNAVGSLEKKYAAMGPASVSSVEYPSDDASIGKFVVYYPGGSGEGDATYPVVLWANGTGSNSDTYTYFLRHLASWGFIVVDSDDGDTRAGASLNAAIDLLISQNEDGQSPLYHRVDLDAIGAAGHSQGGVAVYNMATVQPHADMIKAVYAVSATSSYHTRELGADWRYDVSGISVPTFMTAGTGNFDAGTATSADQSTDDKAGVAQGICPLWSLEENFALLPDSIDKVYARKTDVDHGDSYEQFDAYMTAWFRYYLAGDQDAGTVFYGDTPELAGNPNYQDVTIRHAPVTR